MGDIEPETWEAMKLKPELLRGILSQRIENPSPLLQRTFFPILNGRDIIVSAPSRYDRKATFSVPILQRLDPDLNEIQALILGISREHVHRTHEQLRAVADHMPGLRSLMCVGGTAYRENVDALETGSIHLVVATPGRMSYLIQRGVLRLKSVKVVCFDEFDDMIQYKDLTDTIEELFAVFPKDIQLLFFGPTMPTRVLDMCTKFSKDPLRISLTYDWDELTLGGLKQWYIAFEKDEQAERLGALYNLLTSTPNARPAVIYCTRVDMADMLLEEVRRKGFTGVSSLHEEMDHTQLESVLSEFDAGSTQVLIATDLAATAVPTERVSLIVNYEISWDRSSYMQRVGCRGKFERRAATAINLVARNELHMLRGIESHCGTQINEYMGGVFK